MLNGAVHETRGSLFWQRSDFREKLEYRVFESISIGLTHEENENDKENENENSIPDGAASCSCCVVAAAELCGTG